MAATGADSSYRPGIYRDKGGNAQVIKATATQTVFGGVKVQAGGNFTVATGAKRVYPVRTATQSLTLDGSDSGVTIQVRTANQIHQLPASTSVGAGVSYNFIVATGGLAASGGAGLKVRPNAADKFVWTGATDSEVFTLAGSTDVLGDRLGVMSEGNVGWLVTDLRGNWTLSAAT